ncbi:MAG TPA: tetratricopeptide repeat protein [Blastocatellia bacterium]|nr:tetratricopeptide repeat protein [Blastocatellia bacterium]
MPLTKTESLRHAQQLVAEGRVSYAISIYQKIVDDDPSDLNAISVLGDLYVKAGRITDAVEHLLRIAENYLRAGSAASAAYILNKVLKIDPANPVAHMNLGELHLKDKEIDRAHDDFIEAGAAFWHKGNITAALRMNKRALDIMPTSRKAKSALALIQGEIDQSVLPEPKKEIVSDLPEIIISIPDGSDAVCAPVTACAGKLQSDSIAAGDFRSQKESQHGLDEDGAVQQIAMAEYLVASGHVDQAIRVLRETLQDKPDHIQIREKLKDIYLRSAMNERASEECVNIAAILIARGETGRAAEYVTRARVLNPPVEPVSPLATPSTSEVTEPEGIQGPTTEWGVERRQAATLM